MLQISISGKMTTENRLASLISVSTLEIDLNIDIANFYGVMLLLFVTDITINITITLVICYVY